jgi:transcriptional regulator with XRE-family HTH domain
MQICMKLSREESADLRWRLRSALKNQRLTVTEIGVLAGVHPSQVSRICRGDFRTMSYNVMQVCRVLGLDPAAAKPPSSAEVARSLIERNLQKLCEVDPGKARQMARLLEEMAELALA